VVQAGEHLPDKCKALSQTPVSQKPLYIMDNHIYTYIYDYPYDYPTARRAVKSQPRDVRRLRRQDRRKEPAVGGSKDLCVKTRHYLSQSNEQVKTLHCPMLRGVGKRPCSWDTNRTTSVEGV
jgi:hypothetical protein